RPAPVCGVPRRVRPGRPRHQTPLPPHIEGYITAQAGHNGRRRRSRRFLMPTLTVTNTNDSGPGSLRQAIADAGFGDTIIFDLPLPATITLTSGQLVVSNNLTIEGPG